MPDSWEVALARLEGKIDALIATQTTLTNNVSDIDKRVRDLETSVAKLQAPRQQWPAIASAIAAMLAVALVLADRLF